MSHQFGDILHQCLHRKHGLSQSKLAKGIGQDPAVITKMCHGQRLTGPLARKRVLDILTWLHNTGVLHTCDEANALLEAAGMARLQATEPAEFAFMAQLPVSQSAIAPITFSLPATPPKMAQSVIVRHKYWLALGMVLAAVSLFVIVNNNLHLVAAGGWQDRILFHGNGWCSAVPVELGQYGWIGANPLYSMFYDPEVTLNSVEYYVYYEDEYVGAEVTQLQGLHPERDEWQFTITSGWANARENWQEPLKWRVDYACR